MRRYYKPILLTLLFLLAGAVVNVAVALRLVVWGGVLPYSPENLDGMHYEPWPAAAAPRFFGGADHPTPPGAIVDYTRRLGVVEWSAKATYYLPGDEWWSWISYDPDLLWRQDGGRAGWPWPAMGWVKNHAYDFKVRPPPADNGWLLWDAPFKAERWSEGVTMPPRGALKGSTYHEITSRWPTMPVWPGFALGALFYAGALAVPRWGLQRMRSGYRRRRNRCAHCGYSLVGNTTGVCPECGAVVRSVKPPPT